jgi:hypothetical protein
MHHCSHVHWYLIGSILVLIAAAAADAVRAGIGKVVVLSHSGALGLLL